MGRIVGIDLGTTNSLCTVFEEGEARVIPNALGACMTPSVVAVLPDGQILIGAAAKEFQVTHPEHSVAWFKRWMGTPKSVELGGRLFTPPELSSLVIRSLVEDAKADLGEDIEEAVITVPAYFNEHQREATRVAGTLAGLKIRRILNEPTAAALTHGLIHKDSDKRILVYDLGGGTLDVTVLEVFEGLLETTATAGESHLGGEDFTERMMDTLLRRHGETLEVAEFKSPLRISRLRTECEHAKCALTDEDSALVRLPGHDGVLDESCPTEVITRQELAEAIQDLLDRAMVPIDRVLNDARIAAEDIDEVVLVGGATRMPLIREAVTQKLSREPHRNTDPDTVVAIGAGIQSALLEKNAAVDDVMMTDVCPFTLGIEIVKEFGGSLKQGYYLPIIHRNTTVPVSREEIVSTIQDNQTKLRVRVYQGEGRKVENNLLLGNLNVSGIPKGPAGQPVAIRFTYDVNGLLDVEAKIEATGKKFQTVLSHHVKELNEDQIEEAKRRLAKLKFYPRDDLKNQHLLRFAEAVVGQVDPWSRESLEMSVDQYEHALAGTDRDFFREARQELLHCLSAANQPYQEDLSE